MVTTITKATIILHIFHPPPPLPPHLHSLHLLPPPPPSLTPLHLNHLLVCRKCLPEVPSSEYILLPRPQTLAQRNVCFKCWQVLDLVVQRLLELSDNNNNNNTIQFLEQLLDRYGHLYKFHGMYKVMCSSTNGLCLCYYQCCCQEGRQLEISFFLSCMISSMSSFIRAPHDLPVHHHALL